MTKFKSLHGSQKPLMHQTNGYLPQTHWAASCFFRILFQKLNDLVKLIFAGQDLYLVNKGLIFQIYFPDL